MKKLLISVLVIAIVVIGVIAFAKHDDLSSGELQKASLQLSWIPSASFTGDVVGLTKFDKENDLDLSAEFGGPGINPIQQVIGGAKDFGWAGADEVLAANEKGADLAIIGVIHYHPAAGYISLTEKGIATPQNMEGTSVGVLPFGNSTMIYEMMLKENNVDRSTITEVTISADMKPFLRGAYDVHPVYVYDETVELDREGIEYNLIKPEDFGVTSIKGYVYFTKRSTIEENPELVEAFVHTMADGWNYAIENPDEAIDMLKDFAPEIDVERERLVLQKGIPYFTAYQNQPLNSDTESWNDMVAELREAGVLQGDANLDRVLQLQFINAYYE